MTYDALAETMMIRKFLSTSALVLSAVCAAAQQPAVPEVPGLPAAARAATASIDSEKIRAHVRFLSLDLLEGRGPGTRGDRLAAEYIATQFSLEGLQPAGENHTWFQRVPLYAVHTIEDKTDFSFVPASGSQSIELHYGEDVVAKDQTGQPSADIDAPIVFVGYGIHAPEYQWDDYAGVDMKGKIALVIVNEPPSEDESFFKGKALTYYGRWTYKYEEAARRGAVGVLIIHRTDLASYGWNVVRNSQAIEKSYLQGDPDATLRAAAWIQHDVAQKLLTLGGLGDLDQAIDSAGKRGFHGVELPVHLKAHIESRVRRYDSTNVIGRVPGAASGGGAVLYTAHYDHLGIDPDAKGDNIYNGAADNGTGCGILLEMARAFAQSTQKPPHDVYFASVTAEEQGLAGLAISRHASAGARFRDHPRPQLRHGAAHRHSAFREPDRRGAYRFLAHDPDCGEDVRSRAASRSHARCRPLLPQRSFFARPRGDPGVLSRSGRAVRGPRRVLGPRTI